jgi:hypothetical protein
MSARAIAVAWLALVVSCAPAAVGPAAVARFELGAAPLAFDAAPFPGDFRLASDGTVALGELPTRRTAEPLFDRLRALLSARRGFCATCNVYFPIEGDLDRASVPAETTGLATDAIVLVDVDEASPEHGRFFPLRAEWNETLHLLTLRPAPGIALHARRRYAAAITSDVRGIDGSPLLADAGFAPMRDELVADLVAAGVEPSRIVAATVYTTEDVTAELRAVRAIEDAAPIPVVTIDRVFHAGAELDALLGVPSEDRPGIDVVPMAGTEGTRAIRHGSVALVVAGRITAPRLVTGVGTEVGELLRDDAGALEAGPLEDVTFMLSIPMGADVTQLPIVVHHHGFNASRTTGFVLAETAARAGSALLAIDAYQHGDRAASAMDELDAMRGDGVMGADGFAETSLADVTTRVFGLSGVPAGQQLYPGYQLAAFVQFAADVVATVRFVREGDLAPLAMADASLAGLAFDDAAIDYTGNSMGSVVGCSVITIEPAIRRAVLNVPPGSIVENLGESPEFRPLTLGSLVPLLGIEGRDFDEVDRHVLLDPIVDLFRWTLEPIDPLALAPHFFEDRVVDGAPDVLFQPAVLDEVAAPLATDAFLTASGATHVTRYEPASHGMLEVFAADSAWQPPYTLPLSRRAEPFPYENPIDAVHLELEAFLRDGS